MVMFNVHIVSYHSLRTQQLIEILRKKNNYLCMYKNGSGSRIKQDSKKGVKLAKQTVKFIYIYGKQSSKKTFYDCHFVNLI